jgi:hypothetical protein
MKALKRFLSILGLYVVALPEFVAVFADIHGFEATLDPLWLLQIAVIVGPAFPRAICGVADPNDVPAAAAKLGGEPVDVRHNLARQRHLALVPRLDEIILHVDHHQRGVVRIDSVERVQLAHSYRHAVEG